MLQQSTLRLHVCIMLFELEYVPYYADQCQSAIYTWLFVALKCKANEFETLHMCYAILDLISKAIGLENDITWFSK